MMKGTLGTKIGHGIKSSPSDRNNMVQLQPLPLLATKAVGTGIGAATKPPLYQQAANENLWKHGVATPNG